MCCVNMLLLPKIFFSSAIDPDSERFLKYAVYYRRYMIKFCCKDFFILISAISQIFSSYFERYTTQFFLFGSIYSKGIRFSKYHWAMITA